MLKKQKIKTSVRKKSALWDTSSEIIQDSIVKAGIEAAEDTGYVAGNKTKTEVVIELA